MMQGMKKMQDDIDIVKLVDVSRNVKILMKLLLHKNQRLLIRKFDCDVLRGAEETNQPKVINENEDVESI